MKFITPYAKRTWSGAVALSLVLVACLSGATALGLFLVSVTDTDFLKYVQPLSYITGGSVLLIGILFGIISTLVSLAAGWFFSDLYDVVIDIIPRDKTEQKRINWNKLFTIMAGFLAIVLVPVIAIYFLWLLSKGNSVPTTDIIVTDSTKLGYVVAAGSLGFLINVLTVAGFMLTVRQLKDFNERILGFDSFLDKLFDLKNGASDKNPLHIISYTPALGYLAQPQGPWKEWAHFLKNPNKEGQHSAKIITLNEAELEKWHGDFKNLRKDRFALNVNDKLVTGTNITACNSMCTDIKKAMGDDYLEVEKDVLPGWYGFFTNRRAIVITPIFLPITVNPALSVLELRGLPPVSMIGYETSDSLVINKLMEQFDYIKMIRLARIRRTVEEVLSKVLPAMQADGGGVVLESIEDKAVYLKFKGACRDCPSQELTIEQTLKKALSAALPADVKIKVMLPAPSRAAAP